MANMLLDIDTIARIGLMFIEGDLLARVLVDPYTCDDDDTDYDAEAFNALKKTLMKLERMNPEQEINCVLWQWYPANRLMATPAVAGKALPATGWRITPCSAPLYSCLRGAAAVKTILGDGRRTHFYPVKASDDAVVGALEITDSGEMGPYEKRLFNCDPIN